MLRELLVLPLGLTVASDKIYEAFLSDEKVKALLHGHSFTGNPLCCAAAVANLDLFELPSTFDNIERITQQHALFIDKIQSHIGILDARQHGTIIAIELRDPSGRAYFSNIRDLAYAFFLERGLLIRPCGNVVFLNPPYCISNAQLDLAYQAIHAFIDTLSVAD